MENITRDNWDELFDIKNSVVYNCTPIDITDWIDKSNDFINCLVTTQTGFDLTYEIPNNLNYTQDWSFPYE